MTGGGRLCRLSAGNENLHNRLRQAIANIPGMARPLLDAELVAEDADAYQPIPPSAIRDVRPEVVLLHRPTGGAWSSLASRIRFEVADVDLHVTATRSWFRERGVGEFRWLIGPSATPEGISAELVARGAIPDGSEPELAAMVLDREPPSVAGIVVQEIASLVDFERMETISRAVFGGPEASDVRGRWKEFQATPGLAAFLAVLDGAPVAYGVMSRIEHGPTLLAGGVTLPEARGRGAYRALIRARWEAACRTCVPVLVTQAQASSRPILESLGFRATGTIQVLLDQRSFVGTGPDVVKLEQMVVDDPSNDAPENVTWPSQRWPRDTVPGVRHSPGFNQWESQ